MHEILGLLHALGNLVLQLDRGQFFADELARRDVLAEVILGLAHVLALVLGISVEDVERDVAKLMGDPEPVAGCQLLAVVIPGDIQLGIVLGLDPAVKVDGLALANSSRLDLRDELGRGDLSLVLDASQLGLALLELLEPVEAHSMRKLGIQVYVLLADALQVGPGFGSAVSK